MARQRNGFRAWLHTFPTLRWIPAGRARRRRRSGETEVVLGSKPTGGLPGMVLAWALALGLWMFEVGVWAVVRSTSGAFLCCRWIIRRNVIGQTIRSLSGRNGTRPAPSYAVSAGPTGPDGPVDLATLGDPYDTEPSRAHG